MKNQPITRRFTFSVAGLKATYKTEGSFRLDVLATALVILLLVATRPAPVWWALMLASCGLIMAIELINTAAEKLIDHLHPDLHETVGVVKDTLSAAVLVSCTAGICVLAAFLWEELVS